MEPYSQYGRNPYNRANGFGKSFSQRNCSNNICQTTEDVQNVACTPVEKPCDINPKSKNIARAYIKAQELEEMYCPAQAICEGTAFPCLNLIFCGSRRMG